MLVVAVVLFVGATARYLLKTYPHLNGILNQMEGAGLYPKTDINAASFEELVRIPYIGEYTARRIITRRMENGPFASLEELRRLPGIRIKNYAKFAPYLTVRSLKQ